MKSRLPIILSFVFTLGVMSLFAQDVKTKTPAASKQKTPINQAKTPTQATPQAPKQSSWVNPYKGSTSTSPVKTMTGVYTESALGKMTEEQFRTALPNYKY